MRSSVANTPLRGAMLGSPRFSCCFAPFTLTGSTSIFSQQSTRTKRTITNLSSKCSTGTQNTPISSIARTRSLPSNSHLSSQFIITSIRRNFSESARLRATSTQTEAATLNKNPNGAALDWNTFFKLRTSRRRYSLISSVLASMTSTAIGVQILSAQDIDQLGAQVMGLDPFIVLGLATAACGALGWLVGPILGNTVWGLVYRQYRGGVAIVS